MCQNVSWWHFTSAVRYSIFDILPFLPGIGLLPAGRVRGQDASLGFVEFRKGDLPLDHRVKQILMRLDALKFGFAETRQLGFTRAPLRRTNITPVPVTL